MATERKTSFGAEGEPRWVYILKYWLGEPPEWHQVLTSRTCDQWKLFSAIFRLLFHSLHLLLGFAMRATGRCFDATIVVCLLLVLQGGESFPDRLSPNQKAPAHARSSAGRALALPSGGLTPANVGRLPSGGAPAPPAASVPQEDGVTREETVSYKEVNGETVRVVTGNFGYQSPEGLPVSVKYMADENGNRASFSIGTAAGGGGSGSRPSSGSQRPGGGGGGVGPGGAGKGGAGGGGIKGGAGGEGDRKYLPPK